MILKSTSDYYFSLQATSVDIKVVHFTKIFFLDMLSAWLVHNHHQGIQKIHPLQNSLHHPTKNTILSQN